MISALVRVCWRLAGAPTAPPAAACNYGCEPARPGPISAPPHGHAGSARGTRRRPMTLNAVPDDGLLALAPLDENEDAAPGRQ
jgi:hypothetical protein